MSVPFAYLTVILIWSTTPLGIAWSSETVSPTMAVLLRMVIAAVIGFIALKVLSIRLPLNRKALTLYGFSVIGVFGGMLLSYLSAMYIPTGMISLVFGFSPILSGMLSYKILGTAKLSAIKKIAMSCAFIGLMIVFSDSIALSQDSWLGIVYIVFAVFFFSLSGVLVKSVEIAIHPAATTVGTLLCSIPLFFLSWVVLDGSIDVANWSQKSLLSIVYLGVFGSLVGFIAYFYVLQKLAAISVSFITMLTPVIAIVLGNTLNDEVITINLIYGTAFIISGLALYQWDSVMSQRKAKLAVA